MSSQLHVMAILPPGEGTFGRLSVYLEPLLNIYETYFLSQKNIMAKIQNLWVFIRQA